MSSSHFWEDDNAAPTCRSCDVEFTLIIRRHHCRTCGGVYCDEHSPYRQFERGQPSVRTCHDCWENIKSRRRKAKEQEIKAVNEVAPSPLAQEASTRKANGGFSVEQKIRFGKPMLSSPIRSRPQHRQKKDLDEEDDESDLDDVDSEGDTSESDEDDDDVDDEDDGDDDNIDGNEHDKGRSDERLVDKASIDKSASASVISSRAPSMRTSSKNRPDQLINNQKRLVASSSSSTATLSSALRKVSQLQEALRSRDEDLTTIVREMLSRLMKKEGETANLKSRLSLVTSHAAALRKRLLFPLQPLSSSLSSSAISETSLSDEKIGVSRLRSSASSTIGHVCSNFVEVKLDDGSTGLRFTAATPSPLLARIGDLRFSEYTLAIAAIQPLSNGDLSPAQRINAQLNRKSCCERLRPGLLLTHINGMDIKGIAPIKAIAQFTAAKDRSLRFYNEPLVTLHRQNADLAGKLHTLTAHTDALGASLELASFKLVSERARFRKHLAVLGASFLQIKRENELYRARLSDGSDERDGLKKRVLQLSQQLQQALSSAQEQSAKAASAMSLSSTSSSTAVSDSRTRNKTDSSSNEIDTPLPAVSMSKMPVLIESYAATSFSKSTIQKDDEKNDLGTGRERLNQRNRGAALSMNTAFEGLEDLTSAVLQLQTGTELDNGEEHSEVTITSVKDIEDETMTSRIEAVDPLFPTAAGQAVKTVPKSNLATSAVLKLAKKSTTSQRIDGSNNALNAEDKLVAQLKALSSSSSAISSVVNSLLASPTASAASASLQMKGTTGTGANLFLRARFAPRAPTDSVEGHTHLVALIQRDNAISMANSAIKEAEEARLLLAKTRENETELLRVIKAEKEKASALETLLMKMANEKHEKDEKESLTNRIATNALNTNAPSWWRVYSDSFQKIALLEASEAKNALEVEVLRSRMKSLKDEVNQYRAKLEWMKSVRGITDDSSSAVSGGQNNNGVVSNGKDASGKRLKGAVDKVLGGKKSDSTPADESAPKKKTPKWRDVIMQAVSKKRKEEAAVAEAVNALLIGDVYNGLSSPTSSKVDTLTPKQPGLVDTGVSDGSGATPLASNPVTSTQRTTQGAKVNASVPAASTRDLSTSSEGGVKARSIDDSTSLPKTAAPVPASSLPTSSSYEPTSGSSTSGGSAGNPFSNPFISSSSASSGSSLPAPLIAAPVIIEDDATLNARLSLLPRSIKATEVKGDSFQRLLQSGTAQRAEGFVLVGYLYKASRDPGWTLFSSWAWRFVTVGSSSCTYYASEFAEKPQSSFNLSDVKRARVLASSESSKPLAFEFTLKNTKTFRFAMQTEMEKDTWFKLFSALAAINEPSMNDDERGGGDGVSQPVVDAESGSGGISTTSRGGSRRKSVIQSAVKAMMRFRSRKGGGGEDEKE